MFGPCFGMQYIIVSSLVLLSCKHLAEEERAGCFIFIVCMMYYTISVICLFLTVPCVGLWCVTVLFPGHTYITSEKFIVFSYKS